MKTDECLHNWVFHYNPFNKLWNAIPRDLYNDYWSNSNHPGIIKSSKVSTLVEIITKTGGDPKQIKKLVKDSE